VTDDHPRTAVPLHARSLAPLVKTRGLRDDASWGYPYDVLVQHGRKLSRIQVKSCFSFEKRRYTGFPIIVASHWRGKQVGYSIEEIDLIAAYVARYDAWYLIPIESLGNLKNIRLYPTGRKLKRPGGFYEKFRDAWHLLKDEN
jgi:hypothetical protein